MNDVLELLVEVTKQYPSLTWPALIVICVIIVLLWKVVETLIPKIIEQVVSTFRRKHSKGREEAAQEIAIRKFVARMQSTNWLSCLRSLSQYHASASLVEIFHPPRLSFFGSRNYYAATGIEKIMAAEKAFAIVGPPGSGKSTLLSILAVTYAEDDVNEVLGLRESRLPLFLSLKHLPNHLKPLPQILSEYLRDAGCNVKEDFVRRQLENGRCIVILDGLDETGDNIRRREVAEWIMKSLSAFPDNRFVVSCRTIEWRMARIPAIPYASILKLSSQEIQGIIENWEDYFSSRGKGALSSDESSSGLTESILQPDDRDLKIIAETPLLLTILIVLYLNDVELPKRKVDIYEVFMRTLLGEWDEVKNLGAANIQKRMNDRLLFFQTLSLYLLENEVIQEEINLENDSLFVFVNRQLESIFGEGIQATAFLDTIVARSGLIHKMGKHSYGFADRGFLDFLAARALFKARDYEKVVRNVIQETWYEPIAQFIDFLDDANLISEMLLDVQYDENILYNRILSHIILSGSDVARSTKERMLEKIRKAVIRSTPNAFSNVDLIRDAYAIEPSYWLKFFSTELIKSSAFTPAQQICEVFAVLDEPVALEQLLITSKTACPTIDLEIAKALKFSTLKDSIDVLWELLRNQPSSKHMYEAVIESLSAKGEQVIPSCKTVLEDTSCPENLRKAAISVMCRLNFPEIIPYLLGKITTSMDSSVHNHLVQELIRYFRKYAPADIQPQLSEPNLQNAVYIRYIKRAMDVVLSLWALLTLGFLVPPIAIGTILYSPGPIFYRQTRIGKDGKKFSLVRFRTMIPTGRDNMIWASSDDPRITPVGRVLRNTGLDILPQYLSVLQGDMSIIGPRPERFDFYQMISEYIPSYEARLNLKPGMTGLAQINYKYGSPITDAMEAFLYDLYYVQHCSLYLDLKIMFRTVLTVLDWADTE